MEGALRLLVFQSTSSVWRTTLVSSNIMKCGTYFNPRPPCGGRPATETNAYKLVLISIHVLRVEDD